MGRGGHLQHSFKPAILVNGWVSGSVAMLVKDRNVLC